VQTQAVEIVIAAFAGLLIGSFLNICIFRMPLDLSVARPRCFCPRCERVIAWYDKIPALSYLALRGRCRVCGERIGILYLAVELRTAAAFAASVAHFGFSLAALKYSLFSAILIRLGNPDPAGRVHYRRYGSGFGAGRVCADGATSDVDLLDSSNRSTMDVAS
jgi:prepilin signal peptidase PulO-like enzyme (type II secretory pathway)